MNNFTLLPNPQKIEFQTGSYQINKSGSIILRGFSAFNSIFSASTMQNFLLKSYGIKWDIKSEENCDFENPALELQIFPEGVPQEQGYRIIISERCITILGHDPSGIFYGIMTLMQLIEHFGLTLPAMRIDDYPEFKARGVMLDISRDRVPTMQTLFKLIDLLASLKYNQFQLYTEHTYAYRKHRIVWENASPLTGEEILILDAYCQQRFIDLVPNQNSFGHMHRWLKHPEYIHLAEVKEGFVTPWGHLEGPFSLCPVEPKSLDFLRELYEELLPHFRSRLFNVGCDETWDLGQGGSREQCSKIGVGKVYLDFLLGIYREVTRNHKKMQFWGDIILQHPELIPLLPKDIIALEWGYEADHPFDQDCQRFSESGVPFYVCPGTSSWNSIAGRTDNAIKNLLNAAENGMKYHAVGYLVTDWGDNGHWQALPVSYPGYAAGAAFSWSINANRDLDLSYAMNKYIFHDKANVMGKILLDLGNTYQSSGNIIHNNSVLFLILQTSLKEIEEAKLTTLEKLDLTYNSIMQIMSIINQEKMNIVDRELIRREIELTARLLKHACIRGKAAFGYQNKLELQKELSEIIEEFQSLWLLRSRPGGLKDSLSKFNVAKSDYIN